MEGNLQEPAPAMRRVSGGGGGGGRQQRRTHSLVVDVCAGRQEGGCESLSLRHDEAAARSVRGLLGGTLGLLVRRTLIVPLQVGALRRLQGVRLLLSATGATCITMATYAI